MMEPPRFWCFFFPAATVQHQSHNEARGSHDASPRMENLWDFTMGKPGELTHTYIRTGAIENGPLSSWIYPLKMVDLSIAMLKQFDVLKW